MLCSLATVSIYNLKLWGCTVHVHVCMHNGLQSTDTA